MPKVELNGKHCIVSGSVAYLCAHGCHVTEQKGGDRYFIIGFSVLVAKLITEVLSHVTLIH